MGQQGKVIFLIVILGCITSNIWSQSCPGLGQNPSTAFPVCGTTNFRQNSVPLCGGRAIKNLCNDGTPYNDKNPYWYKFTCYTAGKLGFTITPLAANEDYDWQLFDITGHDPMDVYTDASLYVSANWSGSYGATGTSPTAQNAFQCSSNPTAGVPTFSTLPDLVVGHDYILLVSHFSDSQSGYTLSFGGPGNTASIVNPLTPSVLNAYAVCNGTQIVLKLNKKVRCNTLAGDGTDFTISGPVPVSVIAATGNGCSNSFDMDSVVLTLNKVLSPGTYTVNVAVGSDANTLTDDCDNSLPTGAAATLKFTSAQPALMDSLAPVNCTVDSLQLVFAKPMNCSSIAPDGSDFRITGPSNVTVRSAKGVCVNGVSTVINIYLAAPIRVNGTFTITLVNGSDGNTLVDECALQTPAGSTISFTTKNIVTADFQANVNTGCKSDTLSLVHNGNGGVTQWQWAIDGTQVSTTQNPVIVSKSFGSHNIKLGVTNGKCTDTASRSIFFPDQTVKAAFASLDSLCPADTLHFTDQSTSNTISWRWDFGNGNTSTSQTPPAQNYMSTGSFTNYFVKLAVQNSFNCADTTYKIITVLSSCYVAVPSAFTPNGDGLNDFLYPLNAFKAGDMEFRVYNRFGQVIFETKDMNGKWDGRVNSQLQGSGTYVWTLSYTHKDTGQKIFLKGTTVLIR